MKKCWQAVLAFFGGKEKHPTTKPPVSPIRPVKYLKWKEITLPNGVRVSVAKDFKPVEWKRPPVKKTGEEIKKETKDG